MLNVQCFGQLAVRRGDEPVGGAAMQPRRLAILAILARGGARGVPRDTILQLLWSDVDEEHGRRLLSQAIYMLRRDLGSEQAIDGGRVLTLDASEISSDVQQFELAVAERRHDDAVQLYVGPFLDGFSLPSAPTFMRWLDDARDALALTFAQSLEQAAKDATARGDFPRAVSLWRRAAAADPLDGRIACALMDALDRSGDRIAALRHAEIHEALVQQELGEAVDATVSAFASELRQRPLALNARPAMDNPTSTDVAPVMASRALPSTALVASVPHAIERMAPNEPTDDTAVTASRAIAVPRPRRQGIALRAFGVLGVLALSALAIVLVRQRMNRTGQAAASPLTQRVLVAPLSNRTDDPALDPFGLMVAEWITQGLSRSGLVEVVDARSLIETARELPATAHREESLEYTRQIATRLRASIVVEGTVFRAGDSLTIQMRIIDPQTGAVRSGVPAVRVLASRPTSALEPLRERVGGVLAVLLDQRVGHVGATGSEPPTYEAYAEYLRGVQVFSRDFAAALPHFARASQLDTTFRQAQLWMAMTLSNMRRYPEADSLFQIVERAREHFPPYDAASLDYFRSGFMRGDWTRSWEAAKRMNELAPQAEHARYALGLTSVFTLHVRDGLRILESLNLSHGWAHEWTPRILAVRERAHEMLGEYERARMLADSMRGHDLSAGWQRVAEMRLLARQGNHKQLRARLSDAMALPATSVGWEPFDPGDMFNQVALAAAFVGDQRLADSLWRAADAWYVAYPSVRTATTTPSRIALQRGRVRVLMALHRYQDAKALVLPLVNSPDAIPEDRGQLALIAVQEGQQALAMTWLDALEADSTAHRYGQPRAWAARIATAIGQTDRAVQLLYRARREGFTRLQEVQVDPTFAPLRSVGAYREFMAPYQVTAGSRDRTSRPQS